MANRQLLIILCSLDLLRAVAADGYPKEGPAGQQATVEMSPSAEGMTATPSSAPSPGTHQTQAVTTPQSNMYPGLAPWLYAGQYPAVSTDYVSRYYGPIAVPTVLPDGTLADTPAVTAARAAHLAALSQAKALWFGKKDDGSYDPFKYGDYAARFYPGSAFNRQYLANTQGALNKPYVDTLATQGPLNKQYLDTLAAQGPLNKQYLKTMTAQRPLNKQYLDTLAAQGPLNKQYLDTLAAQGPLNKQYLETLTAQRHLNKQYLETLAAQRPLNKQYLDTLAAQRPLNKQYLDTLAAQRPLNKLYLETLAAQTPLNKQYLETLAAQALFKHQKYNALDTQGGLNKPFLGPLANPLVLSSGHLAVTPEVAALRAAHLTTLQRAQADAVLWNSYNKSWN